MALDHSLVGEPGEPHERSWTSKDALLYAVGVGAGLGDPLKELEFTTENTSSVTQQVLPTFAVLISQAAVRRNLGDFDRAMLVHAEQAFELHRPLPVAGKVRTVSTVTGIHDKGSGALVTIENEAADAATGEALVTARSGTFIRGEGGFGGDRGTSTTVELPDRPADLETSYAVTPQQALLYRLCGDRNPLHSDPAFAQAAGFPAPILHGLCTYGIVLRELTEGLLDGDATRVRGFGARFAGVVFPGETIRVRGWREDDRIVATATVGADDRPALADMVLTPC
jgi:acyl dehydratase